MLLPIAGELQLAEGSVIRVDQAISKKGHGLRLAIGETKTQRALSNAVLALLQKAYGVRDAWFAEPMRPLSAIAKVLAVDAGDASRHLSLAFLAPDIVKAILDGKAPPSLTAEKLRRLKALPVSWSEQRTLFGVTAP